MSKKTNFRRVKSPALKIMEAGFNSLRELYQISNIETFKESFNKKCKNPIFREFFYNKPLHYNKGFRRDISNYCFERLDKDLYLHSMQIVKFKDKVNFYIAHREIVDSCVLLGNLDEALIELEKIREQTGYSYWYIETKISILSTMNRDEEILELNVFLVKSVDTDVEERDLDILMAMNSSKVPADRCDFMIDAIAEGLNHDSEAKALEFLFRFSPLKFTDQDFIAVCEYLVKANAVDKYNALYRMASISLINHDFEHVALLTYLKLAPLIIDNRLNAMLSIINEDYGSSDKDLALIDICDTYIKGNYSGVITQSELYLTRWPDLANIYEFYVNSLYNLNLKPKLNENGLLFNVINLMLKYIESRGKNSTKQLTKILYKNNSIDCIQIVNLIKIKTDVCHNDLDVLNIYKYLDIYGSLKNPFRNSFVDKQSVCYQLSNCDDSEIDNIPIPEYRKLKNKADTRFKNKDYSGALNYYLRMKEENLAKHLVDEISSKIALSTLRDGQVNKAVSYISDLYFKNAQNLWKLPKIIIFEELDNAEEIDFDNIDLVITIFLILKDEYSEHQTISLYLKDYLESKGIECPSQFIPHNEKEIFLLEHVCSLSILEGLRIYGSDNEYIFERVKILANLLEEISETANALEEFSLLGDQYTKNLSLIKLGKGKLRVDQNRVYSLSKKELLPTYNELIAAIDVEGVSTFQEIIETENNNMRVMRTNKDSVNLAYTLLLEVRDIYTLNPTFGLDNSLNVDIRHNCIVPVLRSVFEKHDLICREVNSVYVDNVFIEETFRSGMVHTYYEQMQDKFKSFSKNVDGHLLLLKKQYMQIGTNDRTSVNSLFKFLFETDDVNNLLGLIKSNSTFEEIIWWIIGELNKKTEELIKDGKHRISNTVPKVINEYLKEIKEASQFVGQGASRITDKISLAKVDINETTKEICGWLDLVKSSGEHFCINIPILSALHFVEKMFPKVEVKLKQSLNVQSIIDGIYLSNFIRIFIIIIENAIKRRNSDNYCTISVQLNDTPNETEITISSLSKTIDLEKVNEINETVNNINYLDKANRESNSGFFKIKRILEKDLSMYNTIILKPKGNEFVVFMKFSHSQLLVKEAGHEHSNN